MMNASPRPPRRKLGVGSMVLVFTVLLLALPVVLITAWTVGGTRRANAEMEKVRASGHPLTAADMEAFYAAPPPEDDVTQLYLRAFEPLQQPEYEQDAAGLPMVGLDAAEIPPVGQEWARLADAEGFLADYAETLDLLHRAARRGGQARYPTKFSHGIAMLAPHGEPIRYGARMLALESRVRAHRGDARGAALSIDAIFKLAGSLRDEPVLVTQLVAMGVNGVARTQIEVLLPQVNFSDEDLLMLRDDLRAIDLHRDIRRAYLGERVMGYLSILDSDMDGRTDNKNGVPLMEYLSRGDDLACYLQYIDRIIATTEQPWAAGRQARANIDAQFTQQVADSRLAKFRFPISTIILPSIGAAADSGAQGSARAMTADVALSAELYRRRHGLWPASIDQLTPEFLPAVPIDPYDGLPLKMVVRDDAIVFYSVGVDGHDDQGDGDESGKPDVIFTLRKPD